MTFMQKIYDFFNNIFSPFSLETAENNIPALAMPEGTTEQNDTSDDNLNEEAAEEEMEERINVAKRTLMTKLYELLQEIAIFENDFPEEYNGFLQRIENLRASYNSSLEELKKLLTFEIDPDSDTSKIDEIVRLQKDIRKFIESTVKFHIISKRLQRLIKKLNILYNVSIIHSKECEKAKVCLQLEKAIQKEREIVEEFKNCYYILADRQLKERVIELLSYVDYQIFKSNVRNSDKSPNILLKETSVMMSDFDEFDYGTVYMAFLKNELSDLLELLPFISNDGYYKALKMRSEKLLTHLIDLKDSKKMLLENNFWNEILTFETDLFEMLKLSKVAEEKIKVKLIAGMDITVDEEEVLVSPIDTAKVALVSIFAKTHDERVWLLMKLLENLSEDITYKEIYFLLVLFDTLGVVKNTSNDLSSHIQKYITKYPYHSKTITEKKQKVLNIANKEYVVMFHLDNNETKIVQTLRNLNFDFKVENNKVFLNSFYFNGLENVLSNLQTNTNNL